jgi:hypothetical protein
MNERMRGCRRSTVEKRERFKLERVSYSAMVYWLIIGLSITDMLGGCSRNDSIAAFTGDGSVERSDATELGSLPFIVADNSAVQASDAGLPAPVVAFRTRRDACDHFRGEDPYDAQRAAFLAREVAKQCKGTDQALADLRKRYAHDAKVMGVLKDYEDTIE